MEDHYVKVVQEILEELTLVPTRELQRDGWLIARSFALRNPERESEFRWMYAAPMMYWPAISRYYSNQYCVMDILLHLFVNVSSDPSVNEIVDVYCFRGHWLTEAEVLKLFTTEEIPVKISYIVHLRERGEQSEGTYRCVVKHELLHPMFRNNQKRRYEVHLPNVNHNAYWALHTFMNNMECGHDRSAPQELGQYVAGVVLTAQPVEATTLIRRDYPLMVTMHALTMLSRELILRPFCDSGGEIMEPFPKPEFNEQWGKLTPCTRGNFSR